MSLSARAIERAALGDVLSARERGDRAAVEAATSRLEAADLLALGALADRARAADVGDDVRLHAEPAPDGLALPRGAGLELLRRIATVRVVRGGRVGVDVSAHGLELGQVALAFGASELSGVALAERPLAKGHRPKDVRALVERCGRRALP